MLVIRNWKYVPVRIRYSYIHCAQVGEPSAFNGVINGPTINIGRLIGDIKTLWDESTWDYVKKRDAQSIVQNVKTCAIADELRFYIKLSRPL